MEDRRAGTVATFARVLLVGVALSLAAASHAVDAGGDPCVPTVKLWRFGPEAPAGAEIVPLCDYVGLVNSGVAQQISPRIIAKQRRRDDRTDAVNERLIKAYMKRHPELTDLRALMRGKIKRSPTRRPTGDGNWKVTLPDGERGGDAGPPRDAAEPGRRDPSRDESRPPAPALLGALRRAAGASARSRLERRRGTAHPDEPRRRQHRRDPDLPAPDERPLVGRRGLDARGAAHSSDRGLRFRGRGVVCSGRLRLREPGRPAFQEPPGQGRVRPLRELQLPEQAAISRA